MNEIIFYTPNGDNGYLSPTFKEQFTPNNDITYWCINQYIYIQKARLYNNQATVEKLTNAQSVFELNSAIGQLPINQDTENKWESMKYKVVYDAYMNEFKRGLTVYKILVDKKSQNKLQKDDLFIYASPYDAELGVGIAEDNQIIHCKDLWRGKNILGDAVKNAINDFLWR